MSDIQTVDNTPTSPVPTVEQFKSTVGRQLDSWSTTTVEGLCYEQTETLIDTLAPFYHSGDEDTVPEVATFKEVIANFQLAKERVVFAELTEPELTELVAALAPHFHASAEEADTEKAQTGETNSGSLDQHPF